MGMYRKQIGAYGEELAEGFLRRKRYRIMDRNFQCRSGEIDIVAQIGDTYVFVEVKTRRDSHYGRPLEAINGYKLRNLLKTVEVYRKMKNLYDVPLRVDAIEVILDDNDTPFFNHVENITW